AESVSVLFVIINPTYFTESLLIDTQAEYINIILATRYIIQHNDIVLGLIHFLNHTGTGKVPAIENHINRIEGEIIIDVIIKAQRNPNTICVLLLLGIYFSKAHEDKEDHKDTARFHI